VKEFSLAEGVERNFFEATQSLTHTAVGQAFMNQKKAMPLSY
jgi:hypothetical protein